MPVAGMRYGLNPNLDATQPPPVMEARRWIADRVFPADRPLLNMSQAAPVEPPPPRLRAEIARIATEDPAAHLYGPVLGLPDLRQEVADRWSRAYGGRIAPEQVAMTSGCNEAFTATLSAIAAPGDEVLLTTPWYFNHKMHLDMAGIRTVAVPADAALLPELKALAAAIGPTTRAIVLVTPNNPTGAEYPAGLVREIFDLARAHGLALVLDETYRDFDGRDGRPHGLFTLPDWDDTLIQLYSFSKAYRLTGHRIGAAIAAPALLAQLEKYLDTVTICPNQIGQRAALWGMRNLSEWLAGERQEILGRRSAIRAGFAELAGWELLGSGAYFAYVRHPFQMPSDALARRLVEEAGVLLLPGTMFTPPGDAFGLSTLRIAFANADRAGIGELFSRLAAVRL